MSLPASRKLNGSGGDSSLEFVAEAELEPPTLCPTEEQHQTLKTEIFLV
jgi:hypothetical protein